MAIVCYVVELFMWGCKSYFQKRSSKNSQYICERSHELSLARRFATEAEANKVMAELKKIDDSVPVRVIAVDEAQFSATSYLLKNNGEIVEVQVEPSFIRQHENTWTSYFPTKEAAVEQLRNWIFQETWRMKKAQESFEKYKKRAMSLRDALAKS